MGEDSPVALQRAIFYYIGKTYCLQSGEEQQGLKLSQFVHSSDLDSYTYIENGTKNITGPDLKVKK